MAKRCRCSVPADGLTIEQVVDTMLRLSEERGKHMQYGDIQKGLLTGKLKVKGGVIE
jgi:hypothetical protein